jgi:hypothetical protein
MTHCHLGHASTANPIPTRSLLARQIVPGLALLAALATAASSEAAQPPPIPTNYGPQTVVFPGGGSIKTTGASNLDQVYMTPDGWGVTFLEPSPAVDPVYYSPSAGNEGPLYYNFFNTLTRMYPTTKGWNVTGNVAAVPTGSVQVNTYGAIGIGGDDPDDWRVGADFAATYLTTKPGGGSNGNPTTNIHWIQVVATNNKLTVNGMGDLMANPGTLDNKVDVRRTNVTNPYYDQGFAATGTNFIDTPRRFDAEFDNDWIATLFVASGPLTPGTAANPATITVYNNTGVTWGWQNFFFPNVDEKQFIADVDEDVFGDDQLGQFTVDLDGNNPTTGSVPTTVDLLTPSQYGPYEQAFAQSVPESSAWAMMLLGFAGLGYVGYRQSKRQALGG